MVHQSLLVWKKSIIRRLNSQQSMDLKYQTEFDQEFDLVIAGIDLEPQMEESLLPLPSDLNYKSYLTSMRFDQPLTPIQVNVVGNTDVLI